MKKKRILNFVLFWCLLVMCFVMVGCDNLTEIIGDDVPAVYNGFYNYPIGRVDPTGTLTVQNKAAAKVLLFNGTVEPNNFLGIVDSLSSVKLKLPEEKFYSIVAVDASNYEEKTTQAAQTSEMTCYSNAQAFTVSVSTSGSSGAGRLVINNHTSYWVTIKASDLSQNYAVAAPNALRVAVPVEMNKPYDYEVYFTKEVTLNGKIIAIVETTNKSLGDSFQLDSKSPRFTIDIRPNNNIDSSSSLKPSVLVKNRMKTKSIRCYKGNTVLSNGATPDGDFVLMSGREQLFVDFNAGDSLSMLNFSNPSWEGNRLYLNDDTVLENGKVYIIEVTGELEDRACSLVSVEDAEEYFEANK